MARPRAKELTERELEVMQAIWAAVPEADSENSPSLTIADIRDALSESGRDLAYTTVATLVRILDEKGFLEQTNDERPFTYRPARSFQEVSGSLLGDLVQRVFGGSREALLMRLVEQRQLSQKERQAIEQILKGQS